MFRSKSLRLLFSSLVLLCAGCGTLLHHYEDKYLGKAADEAEATASRVYDERQQEDKAEKFDELFGEAGIYGWGGSVGALALAYWQYRKRKGLPKTPEERV